MSGVVTANASPLVVETFIYTVFTANGGVSLTPVQLREVFGLTNISITDLWNNHSHNNGNDALPSDFDREGVTVPFFTVATLMQSIPEEYTPPGKTRADVVEEIFSLANTLVKTIDGQPVYKIPGLMKYYDIITYWNIRNPSGQLLTDAPPAVAGPNILSALGARANLLYNFTLQNCALGTVTTGTKVDTKVQILQNLTDAPTGYTDYTGNYIQTIYNLLQPISSNNVVPYKNNAANTNNYNIALQLPDAPAGFVGTYNAPLAALTAMAPPGKLTPALLKKLGLGASALLGSGYSLPNLQGLYGDVNATDENNIDSIIVTLLDALSSPYGSIKYDSTGISEYTATYIANNFTETSFRDVFSKVKANYPSFTSFTKTVFWKTILPALASGTAANVALARSIMKLIDSAFNFTASNTLKDRLSWFGVYGTNTAPVVAQASYQVYTTPISTPSKSTLAQALFMVASTDKPDDIFSFITGSDSTVNTEWITTAGGIYTASTVSGVSALTPKTFSLSLFNAAIAFIKTSSITPFNDTTAIQINKTDMLLAILASGFLDNIIAYNAAVLDNADQTTVTRIISLTTLAVTAVNKIDTKTSSTETGITVATIGVTLAEYFTFLGSLFGKNIKVYQDSLLKLLVDDNTATTTGAINSQIAFFIDRASNATIAESTTIMWNTKPIVATGAQASTGKSYFGTDVHQNLIKYAFNTSTVSETDSLRATVINTIMALITSNTDIIKFFSSLTAADNTGTALLRNTMFDNSLLDQTLLAGLINSVVIYSYVGMLMTKSKTGVAPVIPQLYIPTALTVAASAQGVTPVVTAVAGSLGTVDNWLSILQPVLFPAYNANTSAVAVTNTAPYLTTTYERVFHTTNMAKFYSSLSDMAVNVILRPVVKSGSAISLPSANTDFTAPGSWMNYFSSSVNIAQSIAGFDSITDDSNEPYLPGYPLVRLFNINMLFQTFLFDFLNGRQTSPNAIYVQVVSGSRAVALGYNRIRVDALLGNIQ